MRRRLCTALVFLLAVGIAPHAFGESGPTVAALEAELRAAETAFAKSMAGRNLGAFSSFIADEAVFFTGANALRGKQAITDAWSSFFKRETAPFSWEPEAVAVLESGMLGLSSGPVFDPEGNRIGTFNSVWRRTDDGAWKVVFDRGCP